MSPDVNVADELDLDFAVPEPGTGSAPEPAARRRRSEGEQTRAVIVEGRCGCSWRTATRPPPPGGAAIALYAEVIEGARIRVPAGLRSRLPELLWLYSLGIVLYWVQDTSPGCAKTYRLIDLTTPLAERLIRLAWLPGLHSLTRRLVCVLDEILA
ncbi:MAG TPA: hypothetical protein VFW50_29815 [Streptosporangiaceae bacterium]|nr:hypothetical protein [Streptosporangiaceae bacterium]